MVSKILSFFFKFAADLCSNLYYGGRVLSRTPKFTLAITLSLALGIGLNSAAFSLFDHLLLNPLPGLHHPAELALLFSQDAGSGRTLPVSYPNFDDLRRRSRSFVSISAYQMIRVGISAGGGEARLVPGEIVTADYFETLAVSPVLGRTFQKEEDSIGSEPVVVLGHGLWQQLFSSEPSALGSRVNLNGQPFTVIGVAPARFKGLGALSGPQLWVSMGSQRLVFPLPDFLKLRGSQILQLVGRLRPQVELPAAEAEVQALAGQLATEHPVDNKGLTLSVSPVVRPLRLNSGLVQAAVVLTSLAGLFLLIVCLSVSNLLLARALSRDREFAIRLSLGAGRGHLLCQLLAEGGILALLGGLGGLAVTAWSLKFLWALRPPFIEETAIDPGLDGRAVSFTLVVSLGVGLFIGLFPILQSYRTDLASALRGARGNPFTGRLTGTRLLVSLQVACCAFCLAFAGSILTSLYEKQSIDPGFDPSRLALISFDLQLQGYSEAQGRAFQQQVSERIGSLPEVESVALAENRPLGGFRLWRNAVSLDQTTDLPGEGPLSGSSIVGSGYFRTAGIRLLRGRDFDAHDHATAAPVVIINETLARRLWPGQEAVGKRVRLDEEPVPAEVVGVAADSKYLRLEEEATPFLYLPLSQRYSPRVSLITRAAGDPDDLLGTLQDELRVLDANLVLSEVLTSNQALRRSLWAPRSSAALLWSLGAIALTLAAVGLYGITSYSTARRRHEVAIRMALGASRLGLLWQLTWEGVVVLGIGILTGFFAALAISIPSSEYLPLSVQQAPGMLLSIAFFLAGVGTFANLTAAVRSAPGNPSVALREID